MLLNNVTFPSDRVTEADQNSLPTTNPASMDVSNTMENSQTVPARLTTPIVYVEQKIVKQPKPDWTARYPKDLILVPKKSKKGIRKPRRLTIKKKDTKFVGLLQGVGGQRSRIKVKVHF